VRQIQRGTSGVKACAWRGVSFTDCCCLLVFRVRSEHIHPKVAEQQDAHDSELAAPAVAHIVDAATFTPAEEPTLDYDEPLRIAQWKASLQFEDGEDETAEAAAKRFEEIFAEGHRACSESLAAVVARRVLLHASLSFLRVTVAQALGTPLQTFGMRCLSPRCATTSLLWSAPMLVSVWNPPCRWVLQRSESRRSPRRPAMSVSLSGRRRCCLRMVSLRTKPPRRRRSGLRRFSPKVRVRSTVGGCQCRYPCPSAREPFVSPWDCGAGAGAHTAPLCNHVTAMERDAAVPLECVDAATVTFMEDSESESEPTLRG
jgi:hypothetical protein